MNTKTVFTITLMVGILTTVSTWLFGIPLQRTLLENALLSTSILSLAFFLFLSIGLFKGIKLKDNIGHLTGHLKPPTMRGLIDVVSNADFMLMGDGITGILLSLILWLLVTVAIGLCFWLFSAVLWIGFVLFIAMLYWVFFRAWRLFFKHTNTCKGHLSKSVLYALAYTILYNCWIYGIILATSYLGD